MLGVSVATVSRALRDSPSISKQRRVEIDAVYAVGTRRRVADRKETAPAQADPYAADGVLKRRAVGQSDGYERKKRRQYQQHGGGFFNSRFYHIKTPLTSNIHKWYYRTIVLLFDYSIIIAKPEPVFKSNLYDDHCLKE